MSTSDPLDKTSPDALARLAEGLVRGTTAPLIGPLEKLIGEGRIRDEDRPRMLIAILLVMLAPFALLGPQNDTLRLLLLAVFLLLVPVTWTCAG